ncbi:MAG: DUF362 domain-containing protein [Sedimentisphaerales bacterium]|nr:DUF362 domain-containing protein [Sedimentisphaerales bacterium]
MLIKKAKSHSLCCPKMDKRLEHKKRHIWLMWLFPIAGLFSLIWFLIRVIPKPSRASYPCQRVAAPLAGGFLIWLVGLAGSILAYRKAEKLVRQSRYILAVIFIAVSVIAVWWSLSVTAEVPAKAAFIPSDLPNSPIGAAKGIYPGRVVWVRDPDATSWDGAMGNWWDENNTSQDVVDYMVSMFIQTLTGQSNDKDAWDMLFRHFNQTSGLGDIGYQKGEKIAIKINMNQDYGGTWGKSSGMPTPQVIYSVLDQLINIAGVSGSAITIYDAARYIGDPIYNKIRSNPDPNFQNITFVVSPNLVRNGRVAATYDAANPLYTKAGTAYLPRCVTSAKYLINMALLRAHTLFGVTVCAKNHFGSVYFPSGGGWTPAPLHGYGGRSMPMNSYNCLVELNGHKSLAGKTLLYMIDGLYPAEHNEANLIRFLSFGDDWASSLFLSQDPVAIDSVALDFLRNEQRCTNVTGNPDNYMHEMALADNPPSGTFYDPERDGTRLASMGVHEHWNNPVNKQYSRNLGTGNGIELVTPILTDPNGPVENTTASKRYNYIRHAVSDANSGDEIVVSSGIYYDNIDLGGKKLTITSANPNDPNIVAATIINGSSRAVSFSGGEDANCVLAGLTVTGANNGIYCSGASPTIINCRIVGNKGAGIKMGIQGDPTVINCIIAGNRGAGVEMWAAQSGRFIPYNYARIYNCTIVENFRQGIWGGRPTITNSIIYNNGRGNNYVQIDGLEAKATFSDIQGSLSGEGNIDSDPQFVMPGYWDENGTPTETSDDFWVDGDYHLQVNSPCINTGEPAFIAYIIKTDFDGEPRIIAGRVDIGCDEVAEE